MDVTPRLKLPLIAAGQAQKHVTHNEAVLAMDALVALHLEEVDAVTPPAAPSRGASYGLGPLPVGDWSGRPGDIAVYDGAGWSFRPPERGWTATVGETSTLHVYDGVRWRSAVPDPLLVDRLGVAATPDAGNPVCIGAEGVLLTAPAAAGSIRVKINRGGQGDTGSLLFQTAYAGRAEIGLMAGEGFALKVSDDAQAWRTAIRIPAISARPLFPEGIDGVAGSPDLLINGSFRINRRGMPPGLVAAGQFAVDRWRAGLAGAVTAFSSGGFRLLSGSVEQAVEPALFGVELSAGALLTCVVEGLTEGVLSVSVGGSAAILTPAEPRQIVMLAQAPGDVLKVAVSGGGAPATFRRLRLHPRVPTLGEAIRRPDEDEALAARYYYSTFPDGFAPGQAATAAPGTVATSLGLYYAYVALPRALARDPIVQVFNPADGAAGAWVTGAGTAVVPIIDASRRSVTLYGGGAEAGTLVYGHLTVDAEPQE